MGQRKVKVGVAGCGVVATAYYLPYLMKMDNVELVAACDLVKTRAEACQRLFGVREAYGDYYDMIKKADIEAVLILTAPGSHVPFTLAAVKAGKHVLLQKPMATNMADARTIAAAVRQAGVVALVEPSSNSPVDPDVALLRSLVKKGVLGEILWFSLAWTGPTKYGPGLDSNPYGQATFFSKDSGGFLFDLPYAPASIVAMLGPCKSVMAYTKISIANHKIVPEHKYDEFLAQAIDPDHANYWDVVVDLPRTQEVRMEAVDNAYSLYTLADGAIGGCHVGRIMHPALPNTGGGALQVYGTEGNLVGSSIISKRKELLPNLAADGWFHLPARGDFSKAKWPQPVPGGFNYYHESSKHFIDCILHKREPLVNVDWGIHITEMMAGAIESSQTGKRYDMTTTLDY
jgi:predicted dehydrogenase